MSRQTWWQRRQIRRNNTAYPPRILLIITQKPPTGIHTVLSRLHFEVKGIKGDAFKGFNLPITPHHSVSSIDDGNAIINFHAAPQSYVQ